MVVDAPLLPHHCFSTLSDNYSYNTWQPVALNMGYICKNILSFLNFKKKRKIELSSCPILNIPLVNSLVFQGRLI